jgi:hypothetical protein
MAAWLGSSPQVPNVRTFRVGTRVSFTRTQVPALTGASNDLLPAVAAATVASAAPARTILARGTVARATPPACNVLLLSLSAVHESLAKDRTRR